MKSIKKTISTNINPGTTKAKPASVLPKVTYKPSPLERLKTWCKDHFEQKKHGKTLQKQLLKR